MLGRNDAPLPFSERLCYMHCLQTELCEEQNGKTGLPCAEELIHDNALTLRTQPAVAAVSRFFVFLLSNDLARRICA